MLQIQLYSEKKICYIGRGIWKKYGFLRKIRGKVETKVQESSKRRVSHEKRYIFRELNNMSMRKVMDYCYRCIGTGTCYYWTIINCHRENDE